MLAGKVGGGAARGLPAGAAALAPSGPSAPTPCPSRLRPSPLGGQMPGATASAPALIFYCLGKSITRQKSP